MTKNRNNSLSVMSFAAFLVLISFVSDQGQKVPEAGQQDRRTSSFIPKKIKPVNDKRIVKKNRLSNQEKT